MLKSTSKDTNYLRFHNIVENSKYSKDDGNKYSKIAIKIMLIRRIAIEQIGEDNHTVIIEYNQV